MSLAEDFERLDLNELYDYVTARQEENLVLDFKLVNRADLNHADDKKSLAKAMSGFANSSGGLIVWGVDARNNEEGIDCAVGTRAIEPLPLLMARLNELTSRAVAPTVDGVRHKPIALTEDSGFAVTLVPESDSGPHMAKLGEDRYYKRNGAAFLKMEHFDLEDMFGRRKKPKLRLEARVARARGDIVLGIANDGRGTAKAPYLFLRIPEPFGFALYGVDGNGHDGLPQLYDEGHTRQRRYGANLNTVIHPNTSHDVTRIEYRGREESRPSGEIIIEYEVAAEGIQIVKSSVTLNIDVAG